MKLVCCGIMINDERYRELGKYHLQLWGDIFLYTSEEYRVSLHDNALCGIDGGDEKIVAWTTGQDCCGLTWRTQCATEC